MKPALSPLQPRRSFKEVLVSSSPRAVKDDGGWVKVVSQRSLRQRPLPSAPPSSAYPIHLRGKCFKCLSPHHVAVCRCSVRCFLCWLTGHRAYMCLQRQKALSSSRCSLVWRPISHSPCPVASSACSMDASSAGIDVISGGGEKKCARHSRRKKKHVGESSLAVHVPSRPVELARPVKVIWRSWRSIKVEKNSGTP